MDGAPRCSLVAPMRRVNREWFQVCCQSSAFNAKWPPSIGPAFSRAFFVSRFIGVSDFFVDNDDPFGPVAAVVKAASA